MTETDLLTLDEPLPFDVLVTYRDGSLLRYMHRDGCSGGAQEVFVPGANEFTVVRAGETLRELVEEAFTARNAQLGTEPRATRWDAACERYFALYWRQMTCLRRMVQANGGPNE